MADFNPNDFFIESSPSEKQPEGWGSYLGRQALAGLEKIPEGILGLHESATNIGKRTREELQKRSPMFEAIQPSLAEQLPIPTVEQFRSGSEKALGYEPGAFTPQGPLENIAQESIRFLGSAGLGAAAQGGNIAQGLQSAIRPAIGAAVGGELGSSAAQALNAPEWVQDASRFVGSVLGGSYGTRAKVKQAYNLNYDKAEQVLPDKVTITSPKMAQVAEKLTEDVTTLPGKKYSNVTPDVEKFKNLLANQNRVNIKKAIQFKRQLNEEYYSYPKVIRDKVIEPMRKSLIETINDYGKENPDFNKPWQLAEKDFGATKNKFIKTEAIVDTAEKILDKFPDKLGKFGQDALKYILGGVGGGVGLYGAKTSPLTTLGATGGLAATAFAANELNKFAGLIKESPSALRIIKEATKQLSLGHAGNVVKILNSLDKKLPQEQFNPEDFILE